MLGIFLWSNLGSAANAQITIAELKIGRMAYHKECEIDEKGNLKPKEDGIAFNRVKALRKDNPFNGFFDKTKKYDINHNFMFFPSNQRYEKARYVANDDAYSSFRLDIEGESTVDVKKIVNGKKTVVPTKYVRLQLQNHTGKNNAYASLFAPTDMPIHIDLVFFALNISCAINFDKTAEEMKKHEKDSAKEKPGNIFLDDPVFTSRKESAHIRKKHEMIKAAVEEGLSYKEYKRKKAMEKFKQKQEEERIANSKLPKHVPWVVTAE